MWINSHDWLAIKRLIIHAYKISAISYYACVQQFPQCEQIIVSIELAYRYRY